MSDDKKPMGPISWPVPYPRGVARHDRQGFSASGRIIIISQLASDGSLPEATIATPTDPGPGGLTAHLDYAGMALEAVAYARKHQGSHVWMIVGEVTHRHPARQALMFACGEMIARSMQDRFSVSRSTITLIAQHHVKSRMRGAHVHRILWYLELDHPLPELPEDRRFHEIVRQQRREQLDERFRRRLAERAASRIAVDQMKISLLRAKRANP